MFTKRKKWTLSFYKSYFDFFKREQKFALHIFEKSSLCHCTDEIFYVDKVFVTYPITYNLIHENQEKINTKKNLKKYEHENS